MMPAPEFRVELGEGGAAGIVRVIGEFDMAACQAVTARFREALAREPEGITLDLHGVTFIDSAGLRAVISFEREARARGAKLRVVPPDERLAALLRPASTVLERLAGPPSRIARTAEENLVQEVELELVSDVYAPGFARGEIREAIGDRLADEAREVALLLTSELVSNAVRHGHGVRIGLTVTVWDDRLRVEIRDGGAGFDPLAVPLAGGAAGIEGGRGLLVVDQLASRWGTQRFARAGGFSVWFELDADSGERTF